MNKAKANITATDRVFIQRVDIVKEAGLGSMRRPGFSYRSSEGRYCEDMLEARAGLRWNRNDQNGGRLLTFDMERGTSKWKKAGIYGECRSVVRIGNIERGSLGREKRWFGSYQYVEGRKGEIVCRAQRCVVEFTRLVPINVGLMHSNLR